MHNAFISRQRAENKINSKKIINSITFSEFVTYCRKLQSEINKNYEHCIIKCSEKDISEYCANSNRFIVSINEIICVKAFHRTIAEDLNSIYTKDIQDLLNNSEKLWDIKNLKKEYKQGVKNE